MHGGILSLTDSHHYHRGQNPPWWELVRVGISWVMMVMMMIMMIMMTTMEGVKCKSGTLLIDCLRDQSPERNPQLSQVDKKARASLSCEEWTHSFEDTLSFIYMYLHSSPG